MAAALSALNKYSGRRIASTLIRPTLFTIRARYRLTKLEPLQQGDFWAVHGAINPAATKRSKAKVKTKQPPKLSVGDIVESRWGRRWVISEVTTVTAETFSYLGHIDTGPVTGTTRIDAYEKTWRTYKPGRIYKIGAAFEKIRQLSEWTIYADARQVLSYRAHAKFNVPAGKNWHHIHEQSAGGKHSVRNLGLVDARKNQVDFNQWFDRQHPGTLGLPLRDFLKGQSEQLHVQWGMRCIRAHGLNVVSREKGRGPYQEIV
jgi:hypothetical protein